MCAEERVTWLEIVLLREMNPTIGRAKKEEIGLLKGTMNVKKQMLLDSAPIEGEE